MYNLLPFSFVLFFTTPGVVLGLDNGLAGTPQMGWNSWNHFRCTVDDKLIRGVADAFVSLGLDEHGYEYVNIDDCWASTRDKNGQIVPDPQTFPNMTALAEYVHKKGLKFGLYSDAGSVTCQHRPGSLNHQLADAKSYATWGVDYLKYDFCDCLSQGIDPKQAYSTMSNALNRTGRPIFYSLCDGHIEYPAPWVIQIGNSWRTSGDIQDNWDSMISKADINDQWWGYAGPGGWNDPDMLEVGNGGMTTIEYETHFSLWALMKAPLLIGCDLQKISDDALRILTNDELIAINQDKLGIQGRKMKTMGTSEIWGGPLSDGSKAVILLNRGSSSVDITAEWSDIGWNSNEVTNASVRDLWAHKDMGVVTGAITASSVPSHGVAVYRITPTS